MIAGSLIVLFVFWLVADQDIIAIQSPYDDEWFLHKGETAYWFDGEPYSTIASFLKEPPYPLFIAATYRLGVPLYLAHVGFYLAAAAVLSVCLVYRQSSAWVGLVVFSALAIHPLPTYIFRRSLHDGVYSSLLLFSAAALLWQFKESGESRRWLRWLATGVAFGLFWNTRQERPLAAVLLGVVWLAGLIAELSRRQGTLRAVRAWIVEWVPPMGIVAALTLAFMGANYARWGVFALTDLSAPNFRRAYQALIRIKPTQSLPYVSITRDMRERAYEVSPSFRELKPHLEGPVLERRAIIWQSLQDIPPLEYSGGWFVLYMREAATDAGLCTTAINAEAYYGRVADEIDAAIKNGLPTQWVPPVGAWSLHPDFETYRSRLGPSWRVVWFTIMGYPGQDLPQQNYEVEPASRRMFDRVARRRAEQSSSDQSIRAQVRHWLWTRSAHIQEPLFASAFLIAGIVLIFPMAAAGWGPYLLPALMFGIYGIGRMVTFVIFDASMFPGTEVRYLLPCVASFSVVSAWLWADGLRRVVGGILRQVRSEPPRTAVGLKVPRAMLAILFFMISAGLLVQWSDQKLHPPDTHEFAGVIRADEGRINGWARLKETPEVSAHVDLYFDGHLAATVIADQFDEGLTQRRIGTGKHAFSMEIPAALKDGKEHSITAKIKGSNYVLWQSPLAVTFPRPEP